MHRKMPHFVSDGEPLPHGRVHRIVANRSPLVLYHNSAKLQEESISETDRERQRYIDEPDVVRLSAPPSAI
jgi:hypothetical protein